MTAYNCQLEDLPLINKRYDLILADPAWWYEVQEKVRKDGNPTRGIGACHHYDQMNTEDMAKLPIKTITKETTLCFMWATCPLLPDAFQLLNAWGFTTYCTVAFVWVKLNPGQARDYTPNFLPLEDRLNKLTVFGPGYYTASNIELILLARKGDISYQPAVHLSQVVYAPRLKEHSRKPDIFQDKIDAMYPDLVKAELFARRDRSGWDCYGNEVK